MTDFPTLLNTSNCENQISFYIPEPKKGTVPLSGWALGCIRPYKD